MRHWNYRLIVEKKNDFETIGICEVYYNDEGDPHLWSNPVTMGYFDLDYNIQEELKLMLEAFNKPILVVEDDQLFEYKPNTDESTTRELGNTETENKDDREDIK